MKSSFEFKNSILSTRNCNKFRFFEPRFTSLVYTSVVPVNMLQVYTLGCYYWSWYLARRGRQQISTTTNRCIDHWQWQWRKLALTHTATSDHNRPREFHCNYVDITSLLWRNVHAETFAFQSCHAVIHRFCLSVTQCTFLRSLLSACGLSYIFVVPLWPWRFLAVDCDGYNITFPPGTTVIFLKL